jgi:hypothetical protein
MTPPLRIFYDADCRFCSAGAARWGGLVARYGFIMVPLQAPGARDRLGLADGEVPEEMKVETRDGRILGGLDGILYVCRRIWWAWPAGVLGHVPGIHALLVWRYQRFAARRNCRGGACRLG